MTDAFEQPPSGPAYTTEPTPAYVEFTNTRGDTVVMASAQMPPGRSRGKLFGAVVGVGALLVAGTFALAQLRSNASTGGAATPEALADQLATSLSDEDILGAADLLLPGERETFRQPLIDFVAELTRLEVADDTADLEHVPGLDIEVVLDDVTVTETNVPDIANVSMAGSATVTVHGDEVPVGDLLIDRVFGGQRPDIDDSTDKHDFDLDFTAVQRDGRWFASLFYSAAERARGDNEIPETGILAIGADSPEAAVAQTLTYIANLDLENLIASLNPNEAEALQRYAPLFVEQAQETLDDAGFDVEVSELEYSLAGEGDSRHVAITHATISLSGDGDETTITLDGKCVVVKAAGEEINSCETSDMIDDQMGSYLDPLGIDAGVFDDLVSHAADAFSDLEVHGIAVDKVDGAWFVSPIGTGLDLVVAVARALDRDEIETMIDDVTALFTSVTESMSSDDGFDTGSGEGESLFEWYDCLDDESDAAANCIAQGVQSGDFDPADIPAPFLYPDCGLFDYWNSGDLYSDSADDFWAQVNPALDCIVEGADRDSVDLEVNNIEFVRPECFRDVNPYDFSDTAALDAAWDCAYG